jgi:hypothetical protein
VLIADVVTAGGVPQDGIAVSAYKASRFGVAPQRGTAPPGGGPDAGPVTSGAAFGGLGTYQISTPTAEDYWTHAVIAGVDTWEFYPGDTEGMTTLGDLIVGGIGGAATRLAVGAIGTVPFSNGTTPAWRGITNADVGTLVGDLAEIEADIAGFEGSNVLSVAGRTGAVVLAEADVTNLNTDLALKAPLASPSFTGTVSAGNLQAQAMDIENTTGTLLILNSTTGAVSDYTEIQLRRGGTIFWRIGQNIGGGNSDAFQVYRSGPNAGTSLAIAWATGAVTLGVAAAMGAATALLVNPTSASGNLLDLQIASASKASIDSTGKGTFNGGLQTPGDIELDGGGWAFYLHPVAGELRLSNSNDSSRLLLHVGALITDGALVAPALGGFVAADKYVTIDSNGNLHKSAIGPAS